MMVRKTQVLTLQLEDLQNDQEAMTQISLELEEISTQLELLALELEVLQVSRT